MKQKKKLAKKNSLNDKMYSIKFFPDFVVFEIDRSKCFNTEYFWNKDLKDKSVNEIAKVDNYVNPRWSTDSYKGLLDKLLYYFSKIFFFDSQISRKCF